MDDAGHPLELILARNLVATLIVPAFVTDGDGDIVFYNEAAGEMLGRRFEETGRLSRAQWEEIGPLDAAGVPIRDQPMPLNTALREHAAAHGRFRIRTDEHTLLLVETSALPLIGATGPHGALVVFWRAADQGDG